MNPRAILNMQRPAAPCRSRWENMKGDDRVRFCSHCRLNVFDLDGLDVGSAGNLVQANDGAPGERLYRRPDGRLLTQNCPVGLVARRARLRWRLCGTAALGVMFALLWVAARR